MESLKPPKKTVPPLTLRRYIKDKIKRDIEPEQVCMECILMRKQIPSENGTTQKTPQTQTQLEP